MKNDCINYFYKNKENINRRKMLIFFFDKIGSLDIKLFFVLIILVLIYKNKE